MDPALPAALLPAYRRWLLAEAAALELQARAKRTLAADVLRAIEAGACKKEPASVN